MAFLCNHDALFLGPNWRVMAIRGDEDTPLCIYDFPVVAFAVHRDSRFIAVLVKSEPTDEQHTNAKHSKKRSTVGAEYVLRVFGFDPAEGEVGALLATCVVGAARRIYWSPSGGFLMLFDTPSSNVTILRLAWQNDGLTAELTVVAQDTALAAYFYQYGPTPVDEWCCLLNDRRQTVDCWDLTADKVASTLQLSRRSIRVLDTVSIGSVVVTLYDDMSVTFAFWNQETHAFVKLNKSEGLFPPADNIEKGIKTTPRLRVGSEPVVAWQYAIFVVGVTNSRNVYRFKTTPSCIALVGKAVLDVGAAISDVSIAAEDKTYGLVEVGRLAFTRIILRFEECSEVLNQTKKDKKKNKKSEEAAHCTEEVAQQPQHGEVAAAAAAAAGAPPQPASKHAHHKIPAPPQKVPSPQKDQLLVYAGCGVVALVVCGLMVRLLRTSRQ